MSPSASACRDLQRSACHDRRETCARLVPFGLLVRLVQRKLDRPAHDLASFRERRDLPRRHRLHEEVAEHGPLVRAREDREAGRARGPVAEERVSRAAADDVDLRGFRAGDRRKRLDRLGVLQRQALEDAARGRACVGRRRLARRGAIRPDSRGHVPWLGERGVVWVEERGERGCVPRQRDELVEGVVGALARPGAPTFVEQPEAGDVPQEANGVADTALVGDVRGEGRVGDHRLVHLEAHERPRAHADEDGIRTAEGHGCDRRARVMGGDGHDGCLTEVCLVGDDSLEPAKARSRFDDPGEKAGRDVEPLDEVARPVARSRVEALRRACVRTLRGAGAAEPQVHEVRDQQHRVGGVQQRVRLSGHGRELEDRVDREQLDSRAVVQLPPGDPLEDAVDGPGPATVPIVNGIPQQTSGPVDEPEVDRPRVDADRGDRSAQSRCRAQSVEHLAVEAEDVPVKGLPQPHGHVREAVDLGGFEAFAVEVTDGDPPALRAEVDGRERRHRPAARSRVGRRRRSRGRAGTDSCGPGSATTTSSPAARHAST